MLLPLLLCEAALSSRRLRFRDLLQPKEAELAISLPPLSPLSPPPPRPLFIDTFANSCLTTVSKLLLAAVIHPAYSNASIPICI